MVEQNPTYAWAVLFSVLSAGLGLGREAFFVGLLGLSANNDQLQLYLSVIYTVSLLGDPIRLASMNLLQRGGLRTLLPSVIVVAVVSAAVVTAWFALLSPKSSLAVLVGSGIAGGANLLVVTLLVHRQRYGHFLLAHVVSVGANIVIFAGILVWWVFIRHDFTPYVMGVVCSVPVFQLVALWLIPTQRPSAAPDEHPARMRDGLRQIGLHAVGSVGGQAAQVLIRGGLGVLLPGALSVFALLARLTDTIRVVFLEPYLGSRMALWAGGQGRVPRLLAGHQFSFDTLGAIVVASAMLIPLPTPSLPSVAVRLVVLMFLGLYLTSCVRSVYSFVNSHRTPGALIRRLGVAELGLTGVGIGLFMIGALPMMLLVWLFYIVRGAVQLLLLKLAESASVSVPSGEPRPVP